MYIEVLCPEHLHRALFVPSRRLRAFAFLLLPPSVGRVLSAAFHLHIHCGAAFALLLLPPNVGRVLPATFHLQAIHCAAAFALLRLPPMWVACCLPHFIYRLSIVLRVEVKREMCLSNEQASLVTAAPGFVGGFTPPTPQNYIELR